jgi:hypothetical protein
MAACANCGQENADIAPFCLACASAFVREGEALLARTA